jgi:hypothetical protein
MVGIQARLILFLISNVAAITIATLLIPAMSGRLDRATTLSNLSHILGMTRLRASGSFLGTACRQRRMTSIISAKISTRRFALADIA